MSAEEQQELVNGYNKIMTKIQEYFMQGQYTEATKQAELLATFLQVKTGNITQ